MPIYQYQCKECGHVFDAMLSVTEGEAQERKACPECHRRKLSRTISAPAIHTRYSPMHPRHMRGQRGYRRKK